MHSVVRAAGRSKLTPVVIGALAFAGSGLVAAIAGIPIPAVHDEYSYLLAADTFSHGRLTNPTHPLWVHFETFHVIQQPTYMSKYPPAQGMALALGQVATGQPIVGVWLSVALMCAAIYWMLRAWLAPRWALLGGLLAVLLWGFASYWSQSYWGGAVAATGGALLFGGLRRIVRQPKARNAIAMGLGLLLLAHSRPFEGLLVSLPVAAALLIWMLAGKGRPSAQVSMARIVMPLLAMLVLTAASIGYYNYRVTGDPFKTPYQVHEETYGIAPFFIWQRLRPAPEYNHEPLRIYHTERNLVGYEQQRTTAGLLSRLVRKLDKFWGFYLGIALTIPLLALPWLLRDRWMAFAVFVCLLVLSEMFLVAPFFPHYVAPIACLIMLIAVQGMHYLWRWRWRGKPVGRWVVAALLLLSLRTPVVALLEDVRSHDPSNWNVQRARLLQQLASDGERHLVVVRYGPKHHVDREWVYNAADIDRAPVVWARAMDDTRNRQLTDYFQGRKAWLLIVDQDDAPHLTPYER